MGGGAMARGLLTAPWQMAGAVAATGVTQLTEMTRAVSAWHDTFDAETALARFSHNGG